MPHVASGNGETAKRRNGERRALVRRAMRVITGPVYLSRTAAATLPTPPPLPLQ